MSKRPVTFQDQELFNLTLDQCRHDFLTDCAIRGLSKGTIRFYQIRLTEFCTFSEAQQVKQLDQVDTAHLRRFLLRLEESGHNSGGRHTYFRVLRTFFFWLENELEGYISPLRKLKPPRLDIIPIEGASMDEVQALLDTCDNSFAGLRDKALLLVLLDTGIRASEALALQWADVNLSDCTVLVRRGKGGKPRSAFFGPETRRALRSYARLHHDDHSSVWVTGEGRPLTYWGLVSMLKRRAKQAGLPQAPSPHDFRRAAALQMLRSGADVVSVSRLLGHAGLDTVKRYLAQTDADLQEVHNRHSPVSNLKKRNAG